MPTINFPANPTLNQPYTFANKTWEWNGKGWEAVQSTLFATTEEVIVDFGPSIETFVKISVGATWVTLASKLNVILSGEATTDHDPEDYVLEEISAMATNIQAGVGFDLLCYAPNGTHGQYKLLIRG